MEKFKAAKEEYERRLQDLQERHDCAKQAQELREVAEQVEVGNNVAANNCSVSSIGFV